MKFPFKRHAAGALDLGMCLLMNGVQWKHRLGPAHHEAFEEYLCACEGLDRLTYFAAPPIDPALAPPEAAAWSWPSPVRAATPTPNNTARIDLYPCERGWSAPTVIFLHALMSASDAGYRAWAARFHARGWNACFLHLPYHYSRTPPGFANGELAITADLVRTGEGLRQAVSETRQVLARLRALGSPGFGLWATSYGGWIGALLASLEADFRWIALMAPVADVEHAIWQSLATYGLRRQLRRVGIGHAMIARHAHLTSPWCGAPLAGGGRVLLAGGTFDRVSPLEHIDALARHWGAHRLEVAQGHFGYRMMPAVFEWLAEKRFI